MKTRQYPTQGWSDAARVVWGVVALLVIGSGCAEPAHSVPRVRFVLVERHWSGWGGRPPPPDTSIVDVAVGDSLGSPYICDGKKPLVLVGILPGGEALVRYAECLCFQRADPGMGWVGWGGGPIGPETLVVRSTWAHLTTNWLDVFVEVCPAPPRVRR